VHNTGGRALDMNGTLQLSAGPGGLNAGPFPANLGISLAIGATEPITIVLDRRVPDGPSSALVTLRSKPARKQHPRHHHLPRNPRPILAVPHRRRPPDRSACRHRLSASDHAATSQVGRLLNP
jgi:hypothetical protein